MRFHVYSQSTTIRIEGHSAKFAAAAVSRFSSSKVTMWRESPVSVGNFDDASVGVELIALRNTAWLEAGKLLVPADEWLTKPGSDSEHSLSRFHLQKNLAPKVQEALKSLDSEEMEAADTLSVT